MFPLDYETPAAWVARVEGDPLALLADHAHCELKAAASAQALIVKNPGRRELVERLSTLSIEEMEHFRQVTEVLHARGGELGPQQRSPYAEALLGGAAAAARRDVLLDRLLVAGLIEARSLERFHLLAEHLVDRSLAELYQALVPSESAHRTLFVRLARGAFPEERVAERLAELRALEGAVVAELPFAVRMHSGMG